MKMREQAALHSLPNFIILKFIKHLILFDANTNTTAGAGDTESI
jgi:hypothetical protein